MKFKPLAWQITDSLLVAILTTAMLSAATRVTTGTQLLSPPSDPLDAVASAPIRTLLTTQWERNRTNERASKRTFESANKNNSTLLLAYAINRLHQNRTREAKEIAERITAIFPENLDGWMLKIWLNTLEDNFDVALVNMRSFRQKIDKARNVSDATRIATHRRLGRLIGYLQGPVADRVNKDVLEGTILAITDGVAPDILKTFNDSREAVLKRHRDLLTTQADRTQVELAKVQAENELEKSSLVRQNQILEQLEGQLIPEKERIRREASQQIAELEQQGSSLQQQLNLVSSDIQTTQLNLQYLYADLVALTRPRGRQFVSTFGLRNEILNAEFELSSLRNEGAGLSNQWNGIGLQISQAQNNARHQLDEIQKEIKRTNGAKRRNLAKLAELARGPKLASGKRNSLKNRVTSLVTYDELSEELYRQQILDCLTIN